MSLPPGWDKALTTPVIAAPMFLVSCPDLVVAACEAGVIGTFPALNQRETAAYEAWLDEIETRLAGKSHAPFGVNLSVRRGNPRLDADIAMTIKHKVPLVITSLGAAKDVVDAVHAYGGLVFHDVINIRHAHKAAEAGVDGLIAVCAGAGGHGGNLSPFAFVAELREFFDKTIILSGAITNGRQIAAARLLGADMAAIGTRFIATAESAATQEQKDLVLAAHAADIVYTPHMTGVNANFMTQRLTQFGLDPLDLASAPIDRATRTLRFEDREVKVWRDLWSAGQGVGAIHDIPTVAALCARLSAEYAAALVR